jgi:carlactone synthase / all-trans-10'-apo-beta-carotenal 13,14-cleaving dioxygenase
MLSIQLLFLLVIVPLTSQFALPNYPSSFTSISGEFSDVPMTISAGTVPAWLKGDFIRNGPGKFEVGERRLNHLFDGYACIVKVNFGSASTPLVSARFVKSDAYSAASTLNEMKYPEFGTPKSNSDMGIMKKAQAFLQVIAGDPTDNACVNTVRLTGGTQLALTETERGTFSISPETLQTNSRFPFTSDVDMGKLQTAHPVPDGTGGWINVGTTIGSISGSYNVYRFGHVPGRPELRELIASIPASSPLQPCWQHSFAVTDRHIILIEQPAPYDLPAMLGITSQPKYACIQWLPNEPNRIHIIDRSTNTFTTKTAPSFFFFHIAGAADADDGSYVNVDLCAYSDPEIVAALYLDRVGNKGGPELPTSRLSRLKIPLSESSEEATISTLDDVEASGGFCDFPAVNEGKYKRYVWSVGAKKPTTVANRIVKTDILQGDHKFFDVPLHAIPGEPVFIPRPGSTNEDDGLIMFAVNLEESSSSEIFLLDAETLELQARIASPENLPYGFHGHFYPSIKDP